MPLGKPSIGRSLGSAGDSGVSAGAAGGWVDDRKQSDQCS
jgi:hypothetical protein